MRGMRMRERKRDEGKEGETTELRGKREREG